MTVSVKCSTDLEQICLLFIFTQWRSQLHIVQKTQGQFAYLAELHFCQKFSTRAQDLLSDKKRILHPARLVLLFESESSLAILEDDMIADLL